MTVQPNPFEVYYLSVLKNKYALFTGRARRSEFWYFILFSIIVILGLGMIDAFTGIGFLSALYSLAVIIPSIAVGIRRLHDTGKSGWWLLIIFIPVIGAIILIYFFILDSQPHDNEYGPSPKRTEIIV